jgi:hypothetical protein
VKGASWGVVVEAEGSPRAILVSNGRAIGSPLAYELPDIVLEKFPFLLNVALNRCCERGTRSVTYFVHCFHQMQSRHGFSLHEVIDVASMKPPVPRPHPETNHPGAAAELAGWPLAWLYYHEQ